MTTTITCNKDYGEGTCEGKITFWDRPSDWKTFPAGLWSRKN